MSATSPWVTLDPATLTVVAVAGLAIAVVALVWALIATWAGVKARRQAALLQARYEALMTGVDGRDLAMALAAYVRRQAESEQRLTRLETQATDLDERLVRATQRVSLLRYRGFEDTGGDQSFSLALLDGQDGGVVVTSLYGRAGSRVYAKPVAGGRSPYTLTTEEQQVVTEAAAN